MNTSHKKKKNDCVISINDQTFETWIHKQDNIDEDQCRELMILYEEWRILNIQYDKSEYNYLSDQEDRIQQNQNKSKRPKYK
jgi:hypothetical protein